MKKAAILITIVITFMCAVFFGLKFQDSILQQKLVDSVKDIQNQLSAHWARVSIDDGKVVLTGKTIDSETHKTLIGQLTRVEGIESVTSHIKISRPLTLGQCQHQIDTLLENNSIQFAAKNNNIDAASETLLSEIAESLWLCPNTSMLIISHTSNEDDIDTNIEHSEQRSSAVLNYFTHNLGFTERQISAIGMGAAFPIAQNDNIENRLLNTRIEILVR